MRNSLIAAAALALAAPAAAQDYPVEPDEDIALPRAEQVEAIGQTLGRAVDAMMDIPVGPVVEAIDPGRRLSPYERERTLGDVAGRDDPYYRERMRDRIGAVTGGLGAMVEQFAILMPVLRRSLEDAGQRIEEAMREHELRRGYDPGRDESD